jgi:tetratricopeptide (TPR) repeat protein
MALMLTWGAAHRRLSLMDDALIRLSGPGLRGLTRYLGGDWGGAARAWRAGWQGRAPEYSDDASGIGAMVAGDWPLAERRARTTLRLVPSALEPRFTLAEIALDRGRPADALETLGQVLGSHPEHVDALLLAAVTRARLGDNRAAIEAVNRALRHGTAGSRPTLFLRVLELAGDLGAAPRRALCLLAHLHRYLRIFDDAHGEIAMGFARQAIAAGDQPADAYLTLGIVLDKRGRHLEALGAFQQTLALERHHAEAYRWAAAEARVLRDHLLQYRMVRAALEAAPADPFYLEPVESVVTRWFGDIRTTAVLMERAVEANPANPAAHERLARAAAALGQAERAAAHARRGAELRQRGGR